MDPKNVYYSNMSNTSNPAFTYKFDQMTPDPLDSSDPAHTEFVNGEAPDMIWNVARLTIQGRLETDSRLTNYLAAGWEPVTAFHAGHNVCVMYLKRLETI